MFDRIVVALDGSETSEQALPAATELARRLGAPLHLLRVADPTLLRVGASDAAMEYAALGSEVSDEEREARAYLDDVAARLGHDGHPATTEARSGMAGREIVAAAQPGDLLVLASHGRSGPTRLLLGSVAEEVTRQATVPVLLVRVARP